MLLPCSYSVEKEPYCWYSQLDREGNLVRDFAVPLPQPIMMHDMALTEDYVIFFDSSLVFKPEVRRGWALCGRRAAAAEGE